MTDKFDRVFQQPEAPDYPATCNECGAEGTNESLEGHVCYDVEQERVKFQKELADAMVRAGAKEIELPAPRAGERDEWRILETVTRTSVINQRGENVAVGMGRGARQRREHAEQIVSDHNQHATLIEQRQWLIETLRDEITALETWKKARGLPVDVADGITISLSKLAATLATIEREGEA